MPSGTTTRDRAYRLDQLEPRQLLATVPPGFTETLIASGLTNPTSMAFAPDGRLFIAQQTGEIRVVKNGAMLATNFANVPENSEFERGLLGVAIDPTFGQAGGSDFIYVYYTADAPAAHQRISRFLAAGDVASGAEQVLVEFPNIAFANAHLGGSINFGADGKLYLAVGDNTSSANAQSMNTVNGKILRFNADGSIPTDNPFYTQNSGVFRSIWALGLRNPFTTAVQRSTGRLFINDVGEHTWEEINLGAAGANFGWPTTEGAFNPVTFPDFTNPILAYNHTTDGQCVIGGAFYEPSVLTFPAQYHGKYFFGDYVSSWIRYMDPVTHEVNGFATGATFMNGMALAADGALWYISRGSFEGGPGLGKVFRIQLATAQPPQIVLQPQNQVAPPGESATFVVSAQGSSPLSFQWQRDNVNITGATSTTYTINAVTAGDDGAVFRCVVTNAFGIATSNAATLTVTQNTRPVPAIITPIAGSTYRGGQVISYSGSATDAEDPKLPASAFTWKVDLHHDTHTHPFMPPTSGSVDGTFTIATNGETSPNVYYRITLTVTDSGGLSQSTTRDIVPRTANLTLKTNLPGLALYLDGQPRTLPATILGGEGLTRTLEALPTQQLNGKTYQFVGWSDGGAAQHTISFPSADATYTAFYRVEPVGTTYLSDIDWVGTPANGWGPVERDMSNGHNGPLDGRPITLNGVIYPKGLGAHAFSSITYNLAGAYNRFISDVGVDDEAQGAASIVFQVFVDNVKLFDSGLMIGSTATKHVDISVAGKNQLRLVINDNGNGVTDDHGDWADARLTSMSSAVPLTLNGTPASDTWTLRLTPAGTAVDVWFNALTSGPPTQTVAVTTIESILVNGLAGDDELILDTTNGAFGGVNRITFDGGAENDTLHVIGRSVADDIDVSSSAIAIGVLPVLQTSVENLRIETFDGDDAINVRQQPLAALQLDGGTGANTLAFRDAAAAAIGADLGTIASNFNVVVHDVAILNFSASQHLGSLKLDGASSVNFTTAGGKLLRVLSLDLAGEAQLDLSDNAMIVDDATTSSLAEIVALIAAARAGGAWTGRGINSSAARDHAAHATTLAAIEASEFKSIYGAKALFAGEAIDDSAVLIDYTYYGDADLNGVVNFDDYARIDAGFTENRTGWLNGDFDYNGAVNFDDYALIDLAFGAQG